ncbi:hypothetical protein [Celeribacter sp.]|uniref:hypothetical protein n=1 Tax=Celeribacter sp. TaxID=1890673 RepID=UPI003A8FD144
MKLAFSVTTLALLSSPAFGFCLPPGEYLRTYEAQVQANFEYLACIIDQQSAELKQLRNQISELQMRDMEHDQRISENFQENFRLSEGPFTDLQEQINQLDEDNAWQNKDIGGLSADITDLTERVNDLEISRR